MQASVLQAAGDSKFKNFNPQEIATQERANKTTFNTWYLWNRLCS